MEITQVLLKQLFIKQTVILVLTLAFLGGCIEKTEPQDHIHGNLGTRYWEQKQYELAEKETRRAIELNPNSSLWHQNLGTILTSVRRNEEGIQEFIVALEIDNDWGSAPKTPVLLEVGYYYYSKRDYAKSIEMLEKAFAIEENEKPSLETLKRLYLYLSYNYTDGTPTTNPHYDLDKAEKLKSKAFQLDPNDLFVKASVTKLLILQGKTELAFKNIHEIESELARAENPLGSVYAYLGHIYSLLNDPSSCSEAMTQAIMLDRENASYLLRELNNDFRNVADAIEMKQVIEKARTMLMQ